jgi:hypothetical protein
MLEVDPERVAAAEPGRDVSQYLTFIVTYTVCRRFDWNPIKSR